MATTFSLPPDAAARMNMWLREDARAEVEAGPEDAKPHAGRQIEQRVDDAHDETGGKT